MMSKPQRLHPAAIIFNFIRILREGIYAIILGFITFRGVSFMYFILALAVILILLITISILTWYRFTYRIVEDELRIEYGIFVKKKRFISKNRIQSIDLTAGVIHRIFKLVKVEIETAGSGSGAEGSLKAVTLAEGERVRSKLKKTGLEQEEMDMEVEIPPQPSFTVSFKRLFLAGSTSGSVGIILAFFFFGFSQLEQFIPESYYKNTLAWIIGSSITLIIGLGIIVLVLLWLFGIAGTMIKYGNFTITKNDNELFITRGLLEKKQSTIPLSRIQAVGIQESMIRQPLGYVTVFAEVAGGVANKGDDFSTVLFPMMKKAEVNAFLGEILPEYAVQQDEMTALPGRAQKYYVIRALLPLLLPLAAVLYFIPRFFWIPVILMILSWVIGNLRFRAGGYHIADDCLIVRYRTFNKITMIMYHKRIQAFERMQHLMHRKEDLATVKLSIIGVSGSGKHYTLKELAVADADQLADWCSYRD